MSAQTAAATSEAAAQPRSDFLAFVDGQSLNDRIETALEAASVERGVIRKGTIVDAIRFFGENRSPKLLVVDLGESHNPVTLVNDLANVCEPSTRVIVIGSDNSAQLFRDLMRLGVSDYLVRPVDDVSMQESILAALGAPTDAPSKVRTGKTIAVASCGGGSGGSSFVANLGWVLAHEFNRHVALVDLDLQTGSLGSMLGLTPTSALADALDDIERVDELFIERAMQARSDRLFAIAAEQALTDDVRYNPELSTRFADLLSRQFHYVLLDVPRAPAAYSHGVLRAADLRVLVMEPTVSSLHQVARQLRSMDAGMSKVGTTIVLNHARQDRPKAISVDQIEQALMRKTAISLPYDSGVGDAADMGEPAAATSKGKYVAGVRSLARELIGEPEKKSTSILGRLFRRKGDQ
ncbi:MAG: AAA family ATPase [Alphaproteobacteria bacterium]|nr:AAA family ATPase [Alphaproteobacteria bacterium]